MTQESKDLMIALAKADLSEALDNLIRAKMARADQDIIDGYQRWHDKATKMLEVLTCTS